MTQIVQDAMTSIQHFASNISVMNNTKYGPMKIMRKSYTVTNLLIRKYDIYMKILYVQEL